MEKIFQVEFYQEDIIFSKSESGLQLYNQIINDFKNKYQEDGEDCEVKDMDGYNDLIKYAREQRSYGMLNCQLSKLIIPVYPEMKLIYTPDCIITERQVGQRFDGELGFEQTQIIISEITIIQYNNEFES